jgi:predicted enzyme related to lactoylglutathione lyase
LRNSSCIGQCGTGARNFRAPPFIRAEAASNYFDPSSAPFMLNYRVEQLRPLLEALRAEGCQVDDKVDESEFGKFGWVIDPDGNKIELWEPPEGQ